MKIKVYKPHNEYSLDLFGDNYQPIHSWDFEWLFQYRDLTEEELSGQSILPIASSPDLLSKIGLVGNPHQRRDCFFYEMKEGKTKGNREIEVSPSENPNRYPSIQFPGIPTSTLNVQTSGIREINTLIYFVMHHRTLHYFPSEHILQAKYNPKERFPNIDTFSVSSPSKERYQLAEEIPVKLRNHTLTDIRDQMLDLLPFRIISRSKHKD